MTVSVIAISLLAVSVAFAGSGGGEDQVRVRGGHRAVFVESRDGDAKVSASPGFISAAEEQLSAAAAAVAGVAQGAKEAAAESGWPDGKMPRELICDSFGKCKHKLSGAFTKAKHMVTETAQEFEEGVKEAAEVAADKAKEIASKATHSADVGAGKAKQTGEHLADKTKEEITSDAAIIPQMLRKLLDSFTGTVHLLGFATAYGMAMWVTFGMTHVLGRALPRDQFAVVQSKVYPLYFKAMASSLGLTLIGHSLWQRNHHGVTTRLQGHNLAGLIGLVLVNLLYLEPRTSKVMFERMKLEKEEGRGVSPQSSRLAPESETAADTPLAEPQTGVPDTTQRVAAGEDDTDTKMDRLRKKLRELNSYSSLLNVITLTGLSWHLLYLSQHLCRE